MQFMSARCERPTFLQFSAERLSLLRSYEHATVAAIDRRGNSTGAHRFLGKLSRGPDGLAKQFLQDRDTSACESKWTGD
ncbi:MAG: hypothetical protein DWH78_04270 [Planctomycetota bacterium]|nr:MAG: hypothetical protein DWH78_04270 [Planctomycetota bacterium]